MFSDCSSLLSSLFCFKNFPKITPQHWSLVPTQPNLISICILIPYVCCDFFVFGGDIPFLQNFETGE